MTLDGCPRLLVLTDALALFNMKRLKQRRCLSMENKKPAVGHLDCIELVACFVDLSARFTALGHLY